MMEHPVLLPRWVTEHDTFVRQIFSECKEWVNDFKRILTSLKKLDDELQQVKNSKKTYASVLKIACLQEEIHAFEHEFQSFKNLVDLKEQEYDDWMDVAAPINDY